MPEKTSATTSATPIDSIPLLGRISSDPSEFAESGTSTSSPTGKHSPQCNCPFCPIWNRIARDYVESGKNVDPAWNGLPVIPLLLLSWCGAGLVFILNIPFFFSSREFTLGITIPTLIFTAPQFVVLLSAKKLSTKSPAWIVLSSALLATRYGVIGAIRIVVRPNSYWRVNGDLYRLWMALAVFEIMVAVLNILAFFCAWVAVWRAEREMRKEGMLRLSV